MRLETGDLVFTKSPKLVSRIIRLVSSPLRALRGEYIPSHVGMMRYINGEQHVQEALWGRGFVKTPWDAWLEEHASESVCVVHMPFRGKRVDMSRELEEMEGVPYATVFELVGTVGNNNKDATRRDFCSGAVQRVIERALHMPIRSLNRPDNTNPYELYKWAITLGTEEMI